MNMFKLPLRRLLILAMALPGSLFCLVSCDNTTATPGLSDAEIASGLKSLLVVGADTSVLKTNKLDGFYKDALIKVAFPQDAQKVYGYIRDYVPGGQAQLDNFVLALNRGAENAVVEAKPIFEDAITGMSFSDANGILKGSDSAATHYLRLKTSARLDSLFRPKVAAVLDKKLDGLSVSPSQAWTSLSSTYETARQADQLIGGPLGLTPVNTNLNAYVTDRALYGLFVKLAAEEKQIRKDPVKRVTDAIKKIFQNL